MMSFDDYCTWHVTCDFAHVGGFGGLGHFPLSYLGHYSLHSLLSLADPSDDANCSQKSLKNGKSEIWHWRRCFVSEWNMALARAGTPHASTNQRAASLNLSANQVAGKPVTKMSLFFPTSKVKFTMSNDYYYVPFTFSHKYESFLWTATFTFQTKVKVAILHPIVKWAGKAGPKDWDS